MSDRLVRQVEGYGHLAANANRIVQAVFSISPEEGMVGRTGAYFCVSYRGVAVAGGLVGTVTDLAKRQKYDRLSREKCTRLFSYRTHGHWLSRQSVDENREQYAGAVCGLSYEFGFSGYLADIDEIAATLLAFSCEDLDWGVARTILSKRYLPLFGDYFAEIIDQRTSG